MVVPKCVRIHHPPPPRGPVSSFNAALLILSALLLCTVLVTGSESGIRCVLRDNPSAGPTTLPELRINDDYCDCLDGSDEPRTAACPGTSFTCRNSGFKSRDIPSAWLADGHCDCCDGSDEPDGVCADNCAELRAKALAEANAKADLIRKGLAKREEYVKLAAQKAVEDEQSLKTLKEQLSVISKGLETANTRVEKLETLKKMQDETKAKAAAKAQKEAEQSAQSDAPQTEDTPTDQQTTAPNEQVIDEEPPPAPADAAVDDDVEDLTAGYGTGQDPDDIDDHIADPAVKNEDPAPPSADEAVDEEEEKLTAGYGTGKDADDDIDDEDDDEEPENDDLDEEDDEDEDDDEALDDDYDEEEEIRATQRDAEEENDKIDNTREEENVDDVDDEDDNIRDEEDDEPEDEQNDPDDDYDYDHEDEEDYEDLPDDDDDSTLGGDTDSSQSTPPVSQLDMKEYDIDQICGELETSSGSNLLQKVKTLGERAMRLLYRKRRTGEESGGDSYGATDSDQVDSCLRQARDAKNNLDFKKADMNRQVERLEKKRGADYGQNGDALRMLDGKCTKTKIMQYEFEHCPFDIVRQYEHGHAIANLGRFKGWEDAYTMKYEGGDRCWNGPIRSIKVTLVCGAEELVLAVDEPNRCSYSMTFATPAVCHSGLINDLMKDFENDSSVGGATEQEKKDEL